MPDRRPLVLYAAASRGVMRVVACSPGAARSGVVPQLRLAEAEALCGSAARFELHDPHADREALRQLAFMCDAFSPRVAIDIAAMPDCLLLDITGCGYSFGGEKRLAAESIAGLRRRGYASVAGIADTLGAAWAVGHYGAVRGFPARSTATQTIVVPPGRTAEALSQLPIEGLRLSVETVGLLHEFDVRTIGQLMALRRADLPSRFGPELLTRLDQALGMRPELLMPERPNDAIEAAWEFDSPVADWSILQATIDRLLESLLDRLRPRQLGIQRLECSLKVASHEPAAFPVQLLRPTLALRHLTDLIRLYVERQTIPAEVSAIALRAARVAPLEFHQRILFEGNAGLERTCDLTALLERLSGRLGEAAVLRPHLEADAQPEFAYRYEPWLRAVAGRGPRSTDAVGLPTTTLPRCVPICLKARPAGLAIVSTLPGGPPVRFHWEGNHYTVAHFRGPERIETGWWRGADVGRDYYLIETSAGERFWLLRALADGSWFLHGFFA